MPSRPALQVEAVHCGAAGFNYCPQLVASGATCAQAEPVCLYVEGGAFCPPKGPVQAAETVFK